MLRRHLHNVLLIIVLLHAKLLAQNISPECTGVQKNEGYNEMQQRAFLQNYFSAAFGLSPLGPLIPYEKSNTTGISLEFLGIPPLSCEQRLVFANTSTPKTQDTNVTPLMLRPRVNARLADIGPFATALGMVFIPAIATGLGTISQVGIEGSLGLILKSNLRIAAHAHMTLSRMQAHVAPPFNAQEQAYEDVFYSAYQGFDLGVSYRHRRGIWEYLIPYASLGIASTSTLFIVGEDLAVEQNVQYPWTGVQFSTGIQALFFSDRFEAALEFVSAYPILYTARAKVGLNF